MHNNQVLKPVMKAQKKITMCCDQRAGNPAIPAPRRISSVQVHHSCHWLGFPTSPRLVKALA